MKTTLTLGVILLAVGCTSIRPVGPLAGLQGPAAVAADERDSVPDPIIRPAPRPAPPAVLVSPGEVTGANADQSVERLLKELEADKRALEAMPRPSEISVVK